ncbi:MAG: aminodeoxychorismate/anthranilate synthase component II [Aquificaceae bacterium]|nr:aminodeoxychorismate/anthranilate synthase component II [Aquificaceae bacterium]MDW8237687.1 aminodeoxychorismate/anthranilate synthase component II [Aquificaceae bacterium]
MHVLVIDNYDSFTYNLVNYLSVLGAKVSVILNDEKTIQEIDSMDIDAILISPGPCTPAQAGISVDVIKTFYERLPILGVCLGHQAIGYAFGAKIIKSKNLMHGKGSFITHDSQGILRGIKNPFFAIRYHSLVIDEKTMPDSLLIQARSDDNEIMAIRHISKPLFGVQFHPESALSECGMELLKNFLEIVEGGL